MKLKTKEWIIVILSLSLSGNNKELVNQIINGFIFDPEKNKKYLKQLDDTLKELATQKDYKKQIELLFYIATLYFALQEFITANKYFRKALAYDPKLVYYIMGLSYANLARNSKIMDFHFVYKHNYTNAILCFESAIYFESSVLSDEQIYYDLCEIFYEIEEFTQLSTAINRLVSSEEMKFNDFDNDYYKFICQKNLCNVA